MPTINIPELNDKLLAEAEKTLRDSAYVAVGLGVLGFQRAQVVRHEMTKRLRSDNFGLDGESLGAQLSEAGERVGANVAAARAQLLDLVKTADERIAPTRHHLEGQIDAIEELLPSSARSILGNLRAAVAAPEARLRNAVGLA